MKNSQWRIEDVSEAELDRLTAWLSLILTNGDVLLLEGDLGAGKTTLARALIRHLSSATILEIPSPTFSLVQNYQTERVAISHFDLYRIAGGDEVQELGLDDAIIEGVSIIEWPDRLERPPTASHLKIIIEEATGEADRNLTLQGFEEWALRLDRLQKMVRFVEKSGFNQAAPTYMQGDASARAYARLPDVSRPAILMNAPAQPDGPLLPTGQPYSRVAHLSEDVRAFVAISSTLRGAGFRAPEIYAQDLDDGFLILEDLGPKVFGTEISSGRPISELYRAATDVLIEMREQEPPSELPVEGTEPYTLPPLDKGVFLIEAELLTSWYWPAAKGEPAPDDICDEFKDLYSEIFAMIDGRDPGWVLRDYHSPNLIWLEDDADAPASDEVPNKKNADKSAIKHVGIIDFQDALKGPRSYDLVSLLQDARLDIPESLEEELLNYYCAKAREQSTPFDEAEFRLSYAVMGAQRNTKILGIFARLALRDNKPAYLAHMPRIWRYLGRNLEHPELAGLKLWFDEHFPQTLRETAPTLEPKA